ncbi:hypothetical protein [Sphingomonas gilva]|nr:hypothetical protein [Sphingomonas gilva]
MRLFPIAFVLALAACAPEAADKAESGNAAAPVSQPPPAAPAEPARAPATETALTADGWGPLRIGMSRAEIEAALGGDADPAAVGGPDPEACDQFRPARAPQGMLVMVEDGKLARISLVRDADIATDRGISLGDDAARVRAAYGDAIGATPHAYLHPEGGYLTVWARGGGGEDVRDPAARGIRYEIGEDDRVTAIHAGGPAIQHVEGCL